MNLSGLRPGYKVKIVNEWTPGCFPNNSGLMDRYLGTIMTVSKVNGSNVSMCEDHNRWQWFPDAIEYVVEDNTAEDDVADYDVTSEDIDEFVSSLGFKVM